jgi:transcriptional regulator with XRE-family HTH domain
MPASDLLAAFYAADPPHQQALEELRALEFTRDQALLQAHRGGLPQVAIAAETGLSRDEVRRMLARAERADAVRRRDRAHRPSTHRHTESINGAAAPEASPNAARGATMSAMASTDRFPAATITAPTRGALVLRVREAAKVDRQTLARRAGIDVASLARVESEEDTASDELLMTLLLVLGHQPAVGPDGAPGAAPRPLERYDAEQLAAAAAAPQGEQLERALEWNTFAAELAAAGPPDAPSEKA